MAEHHAHNSHSHDDHDHDHDHDHSHGHGHEHDAGWRGFLRYLRFAPVMWRSPVSVALVDRLDPQPGEAIVDLGAGYGPAAVEIAARGATVTAVDPTPSMRVILGGRRLLQRDRDRVVVSDGAAESLPIPTESVDGVVSCNTMHHWGDPSKAAAELLRILRPGGRLLLADEIFTDPAHSHYETASESFDAESDHHHGMTMVDGDEIRDLLATAGFDEAESERVDLGGEPTLLVTAVAPGGSGPTKT